MDSMTTTIYCICGLPANGHVSDFGVFCSPECHQIAVYMDRTRAKEDAWMIRQYTKVPGLRDTLEILKWEHKLALAGL